MSIKQYIEINSIFLNNLEELIFIKKINKSKFCNDIDISPSLLT